MNVEETLSEICMKFHCSCDDVKGRSKQGNVADARRLFCYIMRKDGMHPNEIGKMIFRDRTTVIGAIKKTVSLLEVKDKETIEILKSLDIEI